LRKHFAGLLGHHARGVPVGPVRVGLPDALLVLAVGGRLLATGRQGELQIKLVAGPTYGPDAVRPVPIGSLARTQELLTPGDDTPSGVPEESHFQLREYGLAVRQESVQKYQSKSA
jgi:hypothetical protein